MSLSAIRAKFGPAGITDLAPAYGRVGAITDDTQMALFTAEGLLRADARWRGRGICHVPSVVRHAYLRWLHTQAECSPAIDDFSGDGRRGLTAGWSGSNRSMIAAPPATPASRHFAGRRWDRLRSR